MPIYQLDRYAVVCDRDGCTCEIQVWALDAGMAADLAVKAGWAKTAWMTSRTMECPACQKKTED